MNPSLLTGAERLLRRSHIRVAVQARGLRTHQLDRARRQCLRLNLQPLKTQWDIPFKPYISLSWDVIARKCIYNGFWLYVMPRIRVYYICIGTFL